MGRVLVRRNFVLILRFKYDSQYRCGNAILPDHRGRRYSCRKREKNMIDSIYQRKAGRQLDLHRRCTKPEKFERDEKKRMLEKMLERKKAFR